MRRLPDRADRDADKIDRIEEAEVLTRHVWDHHAVVRRIAVLDRLDKQERDVSRIDRGYQEAEYMLRATWKVMAPHMMMHRIVKPRSSPWRVLAVLASRSRRKSCTMRIVRTMSMKR